MNPYRWDAEESPTFTRMPVVREFEVQKVAVQSILDRRELQYLRGRTEFKAIEDAANERLILNLHAYILKGPEKEVKRETTTKTKTEDTPGGYFRSIETLYAIPASWWDHVKADVVSRLGAFGRWWLHRWPVEVRLRASFIGLTVGPSITHTTINNTTNITRETRTCRHIPVTKDSQGYHPHLRFLSFDDDNPPRPPRPTPYCPVCMSPPDHPVREENCC